MVEQSDCSHEIQLHGLCAICGVDITLLQATGDGASTRAIPIEPTSFRLTHNSAGLVVSSKIALAEAQDTKERLLKQKRLSLLCDLDQTLIHADVDPTIGKWKDDPDNPNYNALKDVAVLKLGDNHVYYIKPRPGAEEFLKTVHQYYELHVYTMGSREYAERVARILDPESIYFKDRILHRDANQSLTKDIKRLFPADQSMVVAIDDRADVWKYSSHLIKVKPYRFFPDIGDINNPSPYQSQLKDLEADNLKKRTITCVNNGNEGNNAKTDEMLKPQEEEEEEGDKKLEAEMTVVDDTNEVAREELIEKLKDQQPLAHFKGAKPVLMEDDDELLKHTLPRLVRIHQDFFPQSNSIETTKNVKDMIEIIRSEILQGVYIVFSGCFPREVAAHKSDQWFIATWLGAKCSETINSQTTHLIAQNPGTSKVHEARLRGRVKIVKEKWLRDCLDQFKWVSEAAYFHESIPLPQELPQESPQGPPLKKKKIVAPLQLVIGGGGGGGESGSELDTETELLIHSPSADVQNVWKAMADDDFVDGLDDEDRELLENISEDEEYQKMQQVLESQQFSPSSSSSPSPTSSPLTSLNGAGEYGGKSRGKRRKIPGKSKLRQEVFESNDEEDLQPLQQIVSSNSEVSMDEIFDQQLEEAFSDVDVEEQEVEEAWEGEKDGYESEEEEEED